MFSPQSAGLMSIASQQEVPNPMGTSGGIDILSIQDDLKGMSDGQLTQALQGGTPTYLIASEKNRRLKMRKDYESRKSAQERTVVEDLFAPQQNPQVGSMQQGFSPNQGLNSLPGGAQQPVRMMADGGGVFSGASVALDRKIAAKQQQIEQQRNQMERVNLGDTSPIGRFFMGNPTPGGIEELEAQLAALTSERGIRNREQHIKESTRQDNLITGEDILNFFSTGLPEEEPSEEEIQAANLAAATAREDEALRLYPLSEIEVAAAKAAAEAAAKAAAEATRLEDIAKQQRDDQQRDEDDQGDNQQGDQGDGEDRKEEDPRGAARQLAFLEAALRIGTSQSPTLTGALAEGIPAISSFREDINDISERAYREAQTKFYETGGSNASAIQSRITSRVEDAMGSFTDLLSLDEALTSLRTLGITGQIREAAEDKMRAMPGSASKYDPAQSTNLLNIIRQALTDWYSLPYGLSMTGAAASTPSVASVNLENETRK